MSSTTALAFDLTTTEDLTETTTETPANVTTEAVIAPAEEPTEPATEIPESSIAATDLVETPALTPVALDATPAPAGKIAAWRAQVGNAGLAAAGTGVVIAVGGGIWAALVNVPAPIAIMAGYCTLAGALCATVALRRPPAAPAPADAPAVSNGPTTHFEAWRLVNKFSVSDASRLWCDLEPGSSVTQETIAWARVMLDAISRGELPMVERIGARKEAIEHERNNPSWHTEMTREALTAWAKSHDFNPRFLRD